MIKCNLCPRKCNSKRINGENGYCNSPYKLKIARASLHMWEEPCISGDSGSGAVFFCGCNLGCVYCQNREISRGGSGKEIEIEELSDIFIKLQLQGANNINLVTPTHYIDGIIKAIDMAKSQGLIIPIVYNTGSYESVETLKRLEGRIDIYLPDLKYYDDKRAIKYSKAPNYFNVAMDAIKEMYRQVGRNQFDENGMMKKGVIVRHMILPEGTKDSKTVVKALFDEFRDNVYLSIMSQYTPVMNRIGAEQKAFHGDNYRESNKESYSELFRKVTKREYNKVVDYCIELGIENAFIQEGDAALESFIPEWDYS